jgi:hypothetical protein
MTMFALSEYKSNILGERPLLRSAGCQSASRTDSSRGEPVMPGRLGLSEILLAIWVSAAR